MSASLVYKKSSYRPLFWTQFFGALNDNYFKNALVVLTTYKGLSILGLPTEQMVAFASAIFILPFFLFSALAGQINDKFEKSFLMKTIKWIELGIMLIASYGFSQHHISLLLFALFMMGLHSTFFGPAKYSIIPDLVPPEKLIAANAYVELGTFIAVLIGTIAGGLVVSKTESGFGILISGLIIVSVIGILISYQIPKTKIAAPNLKLNWNPVPSTWDSLKLSYKEKSVFNSLLGISWFWFLGIAILTILPVLTKNLLLASEEVVTAFLAVFTFGIAAGNILCERLSFQRIEIGLVPFGSLGMTLFLLDLSLICSGWGYKNSNELLNFSLFVHQSGAYRIMFDLFMIAVFGGIFTVPLYTLLQQRSNPEIRSRVIGTNNILNAFFMVISSVLLMIFYAAKLTIPQIFFLYGLINLFVAIYIYSVVPEFTLRFLSWIVARLIYRIKVEGLEKVPNEGPALLVCNHITYVDWLIISAAVKRPIRFVMHYEFANIPVAKYLIQHAKVIPIAGIKENPQIFENAFQQVSQELKNGELVCIFPEGGLTTTGEMNEFKKGLEHIVKKDPVPVIPIGLNGLWGSIFCRMQGRKFAMIPRRIWFRVVLRIGDPVQPEEAQALYLENKVRALI